MEIIKEYNHFDCTLYMYTSIYMYTDWGKKDVCVSYCMFTPKLKLDQDGYYIRTCSYRQTDRLTATCLSPLWPFQQERNGGMCTLGGVQLQRHINKVIQCSYSNFNNLN